MSRVADLIRRLPVDEQRETAERIVNALNPGPFDEELTPARADSFVQAAIEELDAATPQRRAQLWNFLTDQIAPKEANESGSIGRLIRRGLLQPSSYKLVFNDDYFVNYKRPEVTARMVKEAFAHPDSYQVLGFDDSLIMSTKKKMRAGDIESTLLAVGQVREGVLNFSFAFRLYHSVVDARQAETPMDLMRAFVKRYGLPFLVSGTVHRFIEHDVFPTHGLEFTPIGTDVQLVWADRRTQLGVVEINLAFCWDVAAYNRDLARLR